MTLHCSHDHVHATMCTVTHHAHTIQSVTNTDSNVAHSYVHVQSKLFIVVLCILFGYVHGMGTPSCLEIP